MCQPAEPTPSSEVAAGGRLGTLPSWFTDEERASRVERYLKSPSGRAFARRHFAIE